MAKDFALGLLQGLYNSGVGNPEVQREEAKTKMAADLERAKLNIEAGKEGMVPAGQSGQQNSFGKDHPIWNMFRNAMFPGMSNDSSIPTAFQPDPNSPIPSMDAAGNVNINPPGTKLGKGDYRIPLNKAVPILAQKSAREDRQSFSLDTQERKDKEKLNKDLESFGKALSPYRSQGMGGQSSVYNKAAVANQAAARGLKVLNKKDLTWQQLNAFVNADIASIQRGGGVPTDVQLHESNYNTLLSKIGAIQQFVTSKPASGLVPDETRNNIRSLIKDIIDVDNEIIDNNIEYVKAQYPNVVEKFPKNVASLEEKAKKIKVVGQGDTKLSNDATQPTATLQWNPITGKVEPINAGR